MSYNIYPSYRGNRMSDTVGPQEDEPVNTPHVSYQEEALATESPVDSETCERAVNRNLLRMLHCAMGLSTESGELLDILKRHVFYGKEMDGESLKHFAEELGDVLWYVAVGCDLLETDIDTVMQANLRKLKARYPEKFTKERALDRQLQAEWEALDDG